MFCAGQQRVDMQSFYDLHCRISDQVDLCQHVVDGVAREYDRYCDIYSDFPVVPEYEGQPTPCTQSTEEWMTSNPRLDDMSPFVVGYIMHLFRERFHYLGDDEIKDAYEHFRNGERLPSPRSLEEIETQLQDQFPVEEAGLEFRLTEENGKRLMHLTVSEDNKTKFIRFFMEENNSERLDRALDNYFSFEKDFNGEGIPNNPQTSYLIYLICHPSIR